MKTVTLKQTGWKIGGMAEISTYYGSRSWMKMDQTHVPLGELTRDRIHRCINDGGFGCEVIHWADVDVYEVYYHKHKDLVIFRTTLSVENPKHNLVKRGI